MNRAIPWVIAGGVVVAAATAFVVAAPERDTGPVFIEGSRPVTEDQVREKLVSDGWSGVQVLRRGQESSRLMLKFEGAALLTLSR